MGSSRKLNLARAVCALIATICPRVTAQYGGGSGTAQDPYLIYTAEQLNAIGVDPNHWGNDFKLAADIDLSAYPGDSFHPIGSRWGFYGTRAFSGVFDGDGHTISNLSHSSEEIWPTGFFAYVSGSRAKVRNLTLANPKIDAPKAQRVGALIGSFGSGAVVNCHVDGGSVSGGGHVGGLVGESYGDISDCSCSVEVQGGSYVGGLAGYAEGGAITNCRSASNVAGRAGVGALVGRNEGDVESCQAAGTVVGEYSLGGFAGFNWDGDIISCGSTADVNSTGEYAGGFVGNNLGEIRSCRSSGTVEGDAYVGGFAGTATGTISHCYATGDVQGQINVGGFAGGPPSNVLFCYSTGKVTGEQGVAGFAPSGLTYLCYWDAKTSGIAQGGVGRGKTTAEMMTASTFAGWGYESQWALQEGVDYPRLVWEDTAGELLVDPTRSYGGGTGTSDDPHLIGTAEQLLTLGYYWEDFSKHFKLTADIDLNNVDANDYVPMRAFAGTFDGNGHAVLNFTYTNGGDYAGFFRSVSYTGVIRDVHIVDAVVLGSRYVGILVGQNVGNIQGCSGTGAVRGSSDVGGLVGRNSGRMEGCTAEAEVTGESSVGGLVGENRGFIKASFGAGQATGQTSVGGLVGANHQEILASYSTADVVGETQVGGLVGTAGEARFWMACPAPPAHFVPGLSDSRISACYSAGQVSGRQEIGGLIGKNAGIVMGCYAACPTLVLPGEAEEETGSRLVRSLPSPAVLQTPSEPDVGGLVGLNEYGIVHLSYWDTEVSGLLQSAGGRGKTTAQMLTAETFEGWGFFEVWTINPDGDYPRLAWMGSSGEPIVDDPLRYSAGTGSAEAPYEIWTAEEFAGIGCHPSDWDKHFVLMDDLDCSTVDPNVIWPIGTRAVPFTGSFDGNGHTIANFTYHADGELYVGPFGCVGPVSAPDESTPTISDLRMTGVDIFGFCQVGGLAAYSEGAISSCSVTGRVRAADKNVGGVVGYSLGTLDGCSSDCTVIGAHVVGSLAGYAGGLVTRCSGAGSVTSTNDSYSYAGGLIGENSDAVSSSHFSGDVNGGYTVGGLTALNEGIISQCWAKATVTGSYLVGGLVGYNDYGDVIRESFAEGTVCGGNSAGGLAGYNGGTIQDCYAAGQVSGDTRVGGLVGQCYRDMMSCYSTCSVSGQSLVGGIAGDLSAWGSITSCLWDLDVCAFEEGVAEADAEPDNVFGLSTAQMQVAAAFLAAGWDFIDESENGTADVWWIDEGRDYPRLWWEAGDEASP